MDCSVYSRFVKAPQHTDEEFGENKHQQERKRSVPKKTGAVTMAAVKFSV